MAPLITTLSSLPGLRRSLLLLAEVDWTTRFWVLGLIGVLLLGALVVALVDQWRKRQKRLGPTADEELAQFRAMYERGEISKEEFQRLRSVLGGRIRAQLGAVKHPELEPPPASQENPDSPPG